MFLWTPRGASAGGLEADRGTGHFQDQGFRKYPPGCCLMVVLKLTDKGILSPVVPDHFSDQGNVILGHIFYL